MTLTVRLAVDAEKEKVHVRQLMHSNIPAALIPAGWQCVSEPRQNDKQSSRVLWVASWAGGMQSNRCQASYDTWGLTASGQTGASGDTVSRPVHMHCSFDDIFQTCRYKDDAPQLC